MKYKISELEGALLDAAVAKAKGMLILENPAWRRIGMIVGEPDDVGFCFRVLEFHPGSSAGADYSPSEERQHGVPIIERERIAVVPAQEGGWYAFTGIGQFLDEDVGGQGAPYLIAAMRAYVASKFGEEVELP